MHRQCERTPYVELRRDRLLALLEHARQKLVWTGRQRRQAHGMARLVFGLRPVPPLEEQRTEFQGHPWILRGEPHQPACQGQCGHMDFLVTPDEEKEVQRRQQRGRVRQ